MKRHRALAWFACSVMAFAFIGTASAQHQHTAASMSDEDLIRSAMAAAPPAVAQDAAIVATSADGQMRELSKRSQRLYLPARRSEHAGARPHVRRPECDGMGKGLDREEGAAEKQGRLPLHARGWHGRQQHRS
ncbi:hypothetical protein [Microvirga sp. KLBC 81]|uniref:hypothetical protein n=1 Tax=Microvirga sp. KLBC 81 TaxID=1862707 RepID=UPI001FE202E6|nr:hypothetical protein [Microvirga sp. KLBC 81]